MTRKRHSKLIRAFVTRVHEKARDMGHPLPHGVELYRCTTDNMTMRPLEYQGREISRADWWAMVADTVSLYGLSVKGVTK